MATWIPRTNPPVLQAEDDDHDVFFMQRAFAMAGVVQPLVALPNGQEVLYYLQGQGTYADRSRYPEPCLLLLDLKMPLMDGFEVLGWLRRQSRWRDCLPVVVFTSSALETDKHKAFELGAHEYLVKPSDFTSLLRLVKDLSRRWLDPIAAGHPVFPKPPKDQ